MKKFLNLIKITFVSFSFIACGAGGGGSSSSSVSYYPKTYGDYSSVAIDNSNYAWHVSTNLENSYKVSYFIDDNAHINLSSAWNLTKGRQSSGEKIKVAIIDEDFEVNHPDLIGKIYKKYNVMNDTENITGTSSDSFSHGTAISGFIASDSLGVAPEVELILININLSDSIAESYYLKAFDYAKNQGAKVINCSWGGGSLSQALSSKLKEMYDANINVVFASGNDQHNLDLPAYNEESESPYVLSIGATNVKNDVSTYSNYGSNVDVLAPGGGGKTFLGTSLIGILALDSMGTAGENNTYDLVNNNYTFATGTSFSAPITSGTIALMLAVNPTLTPSQIRTILIDTAEKVGGENLYTNGFNKYRAYGKIDTGSAVQAAANAL